MYIVYIIYTSKHLKGRSGPRVGHLFPSERLGPCVGHPFPSERSGPCVGHLFPSEHSGPRAGHLIPSERLGPRWTPFSLETLGTPRHTGFFPQRNLYI